MESHQPFKSSLGQIAPHQRRLGSLILWVLICLQLLITGSSNNHPATAPIRQAIPRDSLQLDQFRSAGNPIKLAGLTNNASGLTHHPHNDTLLLVNNSPAQLLEYSKQGELLRKIELVNFIDTEAIVHLYDDQFAVAEERSGTVIQITLTDETRQIRRGQSTLLASIDAVGTNHGIEGLAYLAEQHQLYLVLESNPAKLVKIPLGVDDEGPATIISNRFTTDQPATPGGLDDLSGLHFAAATGSLLMLSDESSALIELDASGKVRSKMDLGWQKMGFFNGIPQAEGVTLDSNGNLYICSEPNLLYRFTNGAADARKLALLSNLISPLQN